MELLAVADPSPDRLAEAPPVAHHHDIEEMCADKRIEAVYIATPTHMHADHTVAALTSGMHVVVEKPMATSIHECEDMIASAYAHRAVLVVGHSHSFEPAIREMRSVIVRGDVGALGMVSTWNWTDWVRRPRADQDFDPSRGGGVVMRQGAHQFDIVRYLAGGLARSVRAQVITWGGTEGAYSAFLDFGDGVAGTAVYSGYGHLDGSALTFGIGEGVRETGEGPSFFGLTIATCEKADLRQAPDGLFVEGRERREVSLAGRPSARHAVLDELLDAVRGNAPAVHDGEWGMATLEVCLAAQESAREGREIALAHQVALAVR